MKNYVQRPYYRLFMLKYLVNSSKFSSNPPPGRANDPMFIYHIHYFVWHHDPDLDSTYLLIALKLMGRCFKEGWGGGSTSVLFRNSAEKTQSINQLLLVGGGGGGWWWRGCYRNRRRQIVHVHVHVL